ncbi:alpha/beta fold hydrolase [Sphingomonas sp. Y38-1Y]|uniref:alpha/beta fold hydrolase n=1 Tax=Sphingomonas sp. Y38-1Y TaxID=3078265 RepID=UPI0028ED53BA|nr:alpha/beta fold hydrolase [Sphingomonas sp. Y38-1Y]
MSRRAVVQALVIAATVAGPAIAQARRDSDVPAFFVHGVPATHHLWSPVIDRLKRKDVIAIDLPGFGMPVPAGFDATKEAYVAWLIDRIEAVGTPVDLVAHDWGCTLALRAASLRPDLVRTWAAGGGAIDASYEWHALARVWQTPGAGEAFFADLDREAILTRWQAEGMSAELAGAMVARIDATMGECILRLYRSAIEVGREWQPDLAKVNAPGLVLHGADDQAVPIAFAEQLQADTRARKLIRLDCGHWFPVLRPDAVAAALEAHWAA